MKKVLLPGLIVVLAGCSPLAAGAPASVAPDPSPVADEIESEPRPTAGVGVEATGAEPEEADPAEAETEEVGPTQSSAETTLNHAELLNALIFSISGREDGQEILAEIEASGDTRFVASLIDTLRYQRSLSSELGDTLNALTGQELAPDWFEWVEWAGQHLEIESFAGYPAWKANLFAAIDPNFLRFVHRDLKVDPGSRVEEIVWGGVRVDGIPALDNPTMIDPKDAVYLIPEERVFGVSIDGDTRAYPARFLDWHEMFNDIVGGEPVSLAY